MSTFGSIWGETETLTAKNIHRAPTNFHEIILLFKLGENPGLADPSEGRRGAVGALPVVALLWLEVWITQRYLWSNHNSRPFDF